MAMALALVLMLAPAALAQDAQPTGGAAPPPAGSADGMPKVPYASEIAAAADANGVDRLLLAGLVRIESNFNPQATSGSGARGLTQLMPGTARNLGLRVDPKSGVDDRLVPAKSLAAGARYLKDQITRFGRTSLGLAAYNAGPRPVIRAKGMPRSSGIRAYVKAVVGYRNEYRSEVAAARNG
jgi:soluble lytic murein transglycosylase-like protein